MMSPILTKLMPEYQSWCYPKMLVIGIANVSLEKWKTSIIFSSQDHDLHHSRVDAW